MALGHRRAELVAARRMLSSISRAARQRRSVSAVTVAVLGDAFEKPDLADPLPRGRGAGALTPPAVTAAVVKGHGERDRARPARPRG